MRQIPISAIAAIGVNRAIGHKNDLIWDLKKDMKYFEKLTKGNIVIMGRKTWESIPEKHRPMRDRHNIIITKQDNYKAEGAFIAANFFKALQEAQTYANRNNCEIFIIGGGQIYELALPYTDTLYLTVVDDEPKADVYFPPFDEGFNLVKARDDVDGGYKISFRTYKRRAL
jgi:dihydrofolate reductase